MTTLATPAAEMAIQLRIFRPPVFVGQAPKRMLAATLEPIQSRPPILFSPAPSIRLRHRVRKTNAIAFGK